MWSAILPIITAILPFVIKLLGYIIDKKQNNEELKKQFLLFLSNIDHELPPKLKTKYKEQIERIKQQIEEENKNGKQ